MEKRIELHNILKGILGSDSVYFQPPESIKMTYPAIRYSLSRFNNKPANNNSYLRKPCYELILIDKNPDSVYVEPILDLKYCSFDRHYKAENLNHFVFSIYY